MQADLYPETIARPKHSDKLIIEQAAKIHAEEIARQIKGLDVEQLAEDLVANYRSYNDGYELAKDLEREGYEIDVEFVNLLDDFDSRVGAVQREEEKKWVKMVGFEPKFKVGDRVDMGERRGSHHERYGYVDKIVAESAEYYVKTDEKPGISYIIKAENLAPHNPEESAED